MDEMGTKLNMNWSRERDPLVDIRIVISAIIIKPSETKQKNRLNFSSDFVLNKMLKFFE